MNDGRFRFVNHGFCSSSLARGEKSGTLKYVFFTFLLRYSVPKINVQLSERDGIFTLKLKFAPRLVQVVYIDLNAPPPTPVSLVAMVIVVKPEKLENKPTTEGKQAAIRAWATSASHPHTSHSSQLTMFVSNCIHSSFVQV